MSKVLKVIALVTLSLVLVAGVALAGCAKKVEEMVDPTIAITQYLKGSTVDFDEATLNTMADGGGEAGFKNGTATALYATKFAENKDDIALELFGDEAGLYHGFNAPFYDLLGPGDQQTVQAVFIATILTDAEREVLETSVVGAIDGIDIDMSDAKLLVENIGYLTLYGAISATAAEGWKADAEAWMAAIEAKAVELYGAGAVYAQLTLPEKEAVREAVKAAGTEAYVPPNEFTLETITLAWFGIEGMAAYPLIRMMMGLPDTTAAHVEAVALYPEKADAKAQELYEKTYADCSEGEQAAVAAAVYGDFDATTGVLALPGELTGAEFAAVNDAVYGDLTAEQKATLKSFAVGFAGSIKGSFANGTASTMYPELRDEKVAELYAADTIKHDTDATLTGAEGQKVDYEVYQALEAPEKGFIDYAAVPGFFGLIQAEMTDALPTYQNFAYTTLYGQVSPTSAYGWWVDVEAEAKAAQLHPTVADAKASALTTYAETYAELKDRDAKADELYEKDYADLTAAEQAAVQAAIAEAMAAVHAAVYATLTDDEKADVDAALVHPRQALYRWFAREGVAAMGAAALLIQLSVAEFSFKVTNPNEYEISLDSLSINFAIEGTDVAKLSLGDKIWLPAKEDDVAGEITLRLLAPVKTMDVLVWQVMEGKSSDEAGALAMTAFAKIQAGTAVWDITCDVVVSTEADVDVTTITPDTYTLQWPVE